MTLTYAGPDPLEDRPAIPLGEAVRRRRRQLRMTAAQLADRAGYGRNYVTSIERGDRTPSLPTLGHLARALDTTPAELLRGVDL